MSGRFNRLLEEAADRAIAVSSGQGYRCHNCKTIVIAEAQPGRCPNCRLISDFSQCGLVKRAARVAETNFRGGGLDG